MDISVALKILRGKHHQHGGFLKWLAEESGINYDRMRRLSTGRQLANEADLLAIRTALNLDPGWEQSLPLVREESRSGYDASRKKIASWLVEYLATGLVPEEKRADIAKAIKELYDPSEDY